MVSSSPLPVVGLDVSKATLAVCYQLDHQVRHLEVSNDKAGFAELLQLCGAQCLFVLEATGTYYLSLAYYLHEQGGQVAVLNSLIIRRFIQMHLGKSKTDRKDAQWLLRYGQQQVVTPWQPAESVLVECRQLEQVTEQLLKQKTMVSNSLEALQRQPVISSLAQQRLQRTWQLLDDQVQALEAELLTLLETRFKQEMTLLRSIPGIGRKTAGLLLLWVQPKLSLPPFGNGAGFTLLSAQAPTVAHSALRAGLAMRQFGLHPLLFAGGFTRFDNYRQLIAKAGLSPREYTSGTSVQGKVRITKMGGGLIRGKLFMCSFAARKFNAACKALYDRLIAKGKNGKVALIAVCNKLLKQAFAIIKSGVPYQADFAQNLRSTLDF